MKTLIFIGRVTSEKGVDLLLKSFVSLPSTLLSTTRLVIAGGCESPFARRLIESYKSFENIEFLGHIDRHRRDDLLSRSHALVMPSRFIETFGLVAAEAVMANVVVGWFRWKGIDTFLSESAEYTGYDDQDIEALRAVLEKLLTAEKNLDALQKRRSECAQMTDPQTWLQSVSSIFPTGTKKVLLVTDFSDRLGGIEQHVIESKELLSWAGYTVEIFSSSLRRPSIWSLLVSIVNIPDYLRLKKQLSSFWPDVIWCHSTLRALGPMTTALISRQRAQKLLTIHDLGLFTAFPSRCYHLENTSFFSTSRWYELPLVLLKYSLTWYMRRHIRSFTRIFVPSVDIQPFVRQGLGQVVEALPHFILTWELKAPTHQSVTTLTGLLPRFSTACPEKAVESTLARHAERGSCLVHFAYFYPLDAQRGNEAYYWALQSADFLLPDGIALSLIARQRGYHFSNLNGTDLVPKLLHAAQARGMSVALYWGEHSVLQRAKTYLQATSSLPIVYDSNGYEDRSVDEMNLPNVPTILLVGRWSPRQELWVHAHEHELREKGLLVVSVGGLLDFWWGWERRAPSLFRLLKIEWLYRALRYPKKNLKKTLWSFKVFLYLLRIID